MTKVNRITEDYADIINCPRPVSKTRAQMAISNRAAQFAPFSAVVGHDAAIKETARHTINKKELDEMEKVIIDDKLQQIASWLPKRRDVEIIYFQPDKYKSGGNYVSKIGSIKKIDSNKMEVLFYDGSKIAIEDIYEIDLQPM